MNIPMPPMMESRSRVWAQAWSLPMYQIAPPDFDDTVAARFDDPGTQLHLRMAGGSSTSILGTAVKLGVRGEDAPRLIRIAQRLQGKADLVAAALRSSPGGFRDQALDAHLRLVLGAAIATPELPSAAELSQLARWAVADLAGQRGSQHPVVEHRLRMAAFGALLACDIDLLSRVLALVPARHLKASPQWSLMQGIVDTAEPLATDGVAGIAVRDEATRGAFLRLFDWHRQPVIPVAPDEESPLDVPPILGNYLYAWAWLRVFSPEPCTRVDWPAMRQLMTA